MAYLLERTRVKGRKKILLSEIIQGQAEVIEVVVANHMKIANAPLKKMDLPNGILGGVPRVRRGLLFNGLLDHF